MADTKVKVERNDLLEWAEVLAEVTTDLHSRPDPDEELCREADFTLRWMLNYIRKSKKGDESGT